MPPIQNIDPKDVEMMTKLASTPAPAGSQLEKGDFIYHSRHTIVGPYFPSYEILGFSGDGVHTITDNYLFAKKLESCKTNYLLTAINHYLLSKGLDWDEFSTFILGRLPKLDKGIKEALSKKVVSWLFNPDEDGFIFNKLANRYVKLLFVTVAIYDPQFIGLGNLLNKISQSNSTKHEIVAAFTSLLHERGLLSAHITKETVHASK